MVLFGEMKMEIVGLTSFESKFFQKLFLLICNKVFSLNNQIPTLTSVPCTPIIQPKAIRGCMYVKQAKKTQLFIKNELTELIQGDVELRYDMRKFIQHFSYLISQRNKHLCTFLSCHGVKLTTSSFLLLDGNQLLPVFYYLTAVNYLLIFIIRQTFNFKVGDSVECISLYVLLEVLCEHNPAAEENRIGQPFTDLQPF